MQNSANNPSRDLRYHLTKLLRAMPQQQASKIRDEIVSEMGIDTSTYYRWLSVTHGELRDIPAMALRLFAQKLNTPIENLFNNIKTEI